MIDSPFDHSRAGESIELKFSPQITPDRKTQQLSVEVSTSAAFAADVTQIFTTGIQRQNGSSWVNNTSFTASYVGTQYRYIIPASALIGQDVYIRVGALVSGATEKVYSDPICVHVGNQIDVKGKTPENKGAIRPVNCVLYTTSMIAPGAEAHYYVCNNGLDASPTWEEVAPGEIHVFTNTAKTAENWALNWRIIVNAGTATGLIRIGPQVALGTV